MKNPRLLVLVVVCERLRGLVGVVKGWAAENDTEDWISGRELAIADGADEEEDAVGYAEEIDDEHG